MSQTGQPAPQTNTPSLTETGPDAAFAIPVSSSGFVCPRCKGDLEERVVEYYCPGCQAIYPVVLGIADFRVFPDPWINFEEDWAKGKRVLESGQNRDWQGLAELYWEFTPDVPPELARKYVAGAVGAAETGAKLLDQFEATQLQPARTTNLNLLEIGCGTGGLLAAAAARYQEVIGVDIAFRWLVIARKRLDEAGLNHVRLVCACGQALPFRPERFDRIITINTLEHAERGSQQSALLREARHALRPDGKFFLSTYNRYSLGPEPHMHVWGVGFLPRPWMAAFVNIRKNIKYQFIRLLGYGELKRKLQMAGFAHINFIFPVLDPATVSRLNPTPKRLAKVYNHLVKIPGINKISKRFGPVLKLIAGR